MNTVHFGYSEDTQVKTNHGWKAIKDVDLQEDKILSLNPDTFEMEYTVAENRLNRVAKEPFIKLAKNAIDVLVADEQKLLVRKTDKSRPWELLEAREVKQSHHFPLRGFQYIDLEQHPGHFTLPAITRDGEDLIPEKQIDLRCWLEFFGFWLTCGYFNTGKEDDE